VEREELISLVNENLIKYDMPIYNALRPNIQEYLLSVEEEIQAIINTKDQALEMYKSIKISTNGLVKRIGIARQTLYNNGIVEYIIKRQKEFDKEDVYNIINEKNSDINLLMESVKKMQHRDINEQLHLDKIETLEAGNKNLTIQVDLLNKKNIDLRMQINELETVLRNNKVINLNKKMK
jgi:hypothetical protein